VRDSGSGAACAVDTGRRGQGGRSGALECTFIRCGNGCGGHGDVLQALYSSSFASGLVVAAASEILLLGPVAAETRVDVKDQTMAVPACATSL
jgi:hypothetical protein